MNQVGEQFRQAREAQGVILEQVGEITKIRVRYLEALEQGNYGVLPGEFYTMAFLRSYARFLNLDAAALVNSYRETMNAIEQPDDAEAKETGFRPKGQPQVRRSLLVVLAICALITIEVLAANRFP